MIEALNEVHSTSKHLESDTAYRPGPFEARHAHNELLQQFYAYGVAGVFMVIALYTSFYRHVTKLSASPLKALMFSFLVFVLVRGLADTEPFDLSLPLWAMIMFSPIMNENRTDHGNRQHPCVDVNDRENLAERASLGRYSHWCIESGWQVGYCGVYGHQQSHFKVN
jgi:hypothetical protein